MGGGISETQPETGLRPKKNTFVSIWHASFTAHLFLEQRRLEEVGYDPSNSDVYLAYGLLCKLFIFISHVGVAPTTCPAAVAVKDLHMTTIAWMKYMVNSFHTQVALGVHTLMYPDTLPSLRAPSWISFQTVFTRLRGEVR
jgi:hypothetical protein